MKHNLQENMKRFGTKNLNEQISDADREELKKAMAVASATGKAKYAKLVPSDFKQQGRINQQFSDDISIALATAQDAANADKDKLKDLQQKVSALEAKVEILSRSMKVG